MDSRKKKVVFVHPFGTPEDDIAPYGIVGLMNGIDAPKAGYYAHELSVYEISNASVVLLDVQWYHNLSACRSICSAIREVSPRVPIVLGGYTASILAKPLVDAGVADYVVFGDAEGSFPKLIDAIHTGGDIQNIPNLVGKGFVTAREFVLDRNVFDSIDYLTLDWFPSMQRRLYQGQARSPVVVKLPLVASYKGCEPKCKQPTPYCLGCYGQPATQRRLMGRNLVSRSASRVRDDLVRLSADPDIQRVCIFDDFISMLGEEYAREVFARSFDLSLYMEPHRFFSTDILERMAACFREVELVFYHEDLAGQLLEKNAATTGFLNAARKCKMRIGICVVKTPSASLREAADSYGLNLYDNVTEVLELPDPFTKAEDALESYRRYLDASFSFFLFKLFGFVAPSYLDAIALQLDLIPDPTLQKKVLGHLEDGKSTAGCILDDNPLFRQIMSGSNPCELSFYAAPFARPAGRTQKPIDRIPRSMLLASPIKIEEFEYRLGDRPTMEFSLPFEFVRPGNIAGVAINFVSEVKGAMTNLPYDTLWKICLPLQTGRFVNAGEHAQLRMKVDYRLDPPIPAFICL